MSSEVNIPNDRLRRERQKRGWSQQRVAQQIGTSEDRVSRWERGLDKPSPYFQEKLVQLFGMDAEELDFLASQDKPSTHTNIAHLKTSVSTERNEDTPNQSKRPSRREFLQETGGFIGALALSGQDLNPVLSELYDRLDRALKKPSSVDTITLTHFETLARNSWQLIPDIASTASRNSLSYLLEHLQSVTELLEVSQPTSIHRRLCSIASKLALATGVMLTAMRDFDNAQTYYSLSIEAARESGNLPLEAVGLARSGLALIYDDQAPVALSYVQEARRLAHQGGTTTTRAWLAAVEAEVQANMNKFDACSKALDQAEIVTDHALLPEEDPYKTTFSRSLLAGYKGTCYLRLKKPEMAQVILQEALAQPHPPSIYLQSSMLTDLANTYTQQGEIEEACRVATQAVTMTIYTRIPSMRQYLRDFRQQLERWENTQPVKDLDKQLRLLRHSTVPLGL